MSTCLKHLSELQPTISLIIRVQEILLHMYIVQYLSWLALSGALYVVVECKATFAFFTQHSANPNTSQQNKLGQQNCLWDGRGLQNLENINKFSFLFDCSPCLRQELFIMVTHQLVRRNHKQQNQQSQFFNFHSAQLNSVTIVYVNHIIDCHILP